jgi:hypothetical protein
MGLDLEIGEFLEGPRPHLRQVCLAHWVFTLRPQLQINSLIHRLCTPHSAPYPGRRWTAVAGTRHPVPRGLAGCPQPKLAGRAAFGKRAFLTTPQSFLTTSRVVLPAAKITSVRLRRVPLV